MINLDELKADRAAGTQGPWRETHGKVFGNFGEYITRDVSSGERYVARMDGSTMAAFNNRANARRIARVPELETAYIAQAEKLAKVRDLLADGLAGEAIYLLDGRSK